MVCSRHSRLTSMLAAVDAGRPVPTGTVTFLFTDIEGSTRLWDVDGARMSQALAAHDALARKAIEGRHGTVVKMTGDGVHAAFDNALDALAATVDLQQALADPAATNGVPLRVRCGLHAGVVERRDNDYFGSPVNRAARIMSAAHGGQVLLSQIVVDGVRDRLPAAFSLRDLGRVRLKDLSTPEHVYQVVHPQLRQEFPALRSLEATPNNLPQQPTSFIGREQELAQLQRLLAKTRLLTLTGSGGCGKTRLGLQLAADSLEQYPDGAWLVELAPLADPQLVPQAVATVLGLKEEPGKPIGQALAAHLKDKRALVLLDNCEHLIEAAAHLVEALMRDGPSLSILATSRERLAVPGEHAYRVPSLRLPTLMNALSAAQAEEYDGVRLFVERARAATEEFDVSDANAPAIVSICRRLDGIPLAIELAVPQLRMLQPHKLDAQLREPFRLLVRGSRTAPPRQQTLAAVFDWSYNLLSERESAVFRRLSVFADTWSAEAAIAVCSDGLVSPEDVFGLLSVLVDKSLVIAELGTSEPRYKYLQTTRQYAAQRLLESADRSIPRKLAEAMTRLFAEASAVWPTTATESWLATYGPDLDNLRASLEWAFGAQGDAALGIELTSHTSRIWDELSLLSERQRWFATALGRSDANTEPTTLARLRLGRTSTSAHGDRSNLEPALSAAELFRKSDDQYGLGEALTKAGASLAVAENAAPALPYLYEALETLKPLGPTKHLASCLRSLAIARYLMREFAAARALIAESEAVARRLGDGRGIATAQIGAAELEFAAGSVDAAIAQVKGMLAGNYHNRRQLALALGNLTSYLLAAGCPSEAKSTAFEALRQARALSWPAAIVRIIEHVALLAALGGDAESAAKLLGYGVAFYSSGTATREFTELATYDRLTALIVEKLSPHLAAGLIAEGGCWSEEHAMETAFAVLRAGACKAKI